MAVVGLVMLWSEPLAMGKCLLFAHFAVQATERFTFGFLVAVRGGEALFICSTLLLGAETGERFEVCLRDISGGRLYEVQCNQ